MLCERFGRAELARAKFDFDVVGHYSRPDIFRLTVNEAAARPVAFTTAPDANAPGAGPANLVFRLVCMAGRFAVCKLPPDSEVPAWAMAGDVFSVTRTAEELSVVCRQAIVPNGMLRQSLLTGFGADRPSRTTGGCGLIFSTGTTFRNTPATATSSPKDTPSADRAGIARWHTGASFGA